MLRILLFERQQAILARPCRVSHFLYVVRKRTLQKGAAATEAWTEAKKRTTPAGMGGMVYSKLIKCVFLAALIK